VILTVAKGVSVGKIAKTLIDKKQLLLIGRQRNEVVGRSHLWIKLLTG
jgi:hypothetical protein